VPLRKFGRRCPKRLIVSELVALRCSARVASKSATISAAPGLTRSPTVMNAVSVGERVFLMVSYRHSPAVILIDLVAVMRSTTTGLPPRSARYCYPAMG